MRHGDFRKILNTRYLMLDSATEPQASKIGHRGTTRERRAFALYEVLLGVAIFAVGVLALGRAVENCLSASTLNSEEEAVRQMLANRMAEVQAAPGSPDRAKEFKIDSGYGVVTLIQKSAPANLVEPNNTQLDGIDLVTLTAQWERRASRQSKQLNFYVYRPR
jgi:Tfp pilus assembly protein PilV